MEREEKCLTDVCSPDGANNPICKWGITQLDTAQNVHTIMVPFSFVMKTDNQWTLALFKLLRMEGAA